MSNPIKVINHEGFITDLRAAHKGQRGGMKLRARNPDRKQFYPEKNRISRFGDGTLTKSRFQQDLPVRFATYFAFYGNPIVLNAVANIYKAGGINVFYTPSK